MDALKNFLTSFFEQIHDLIGTVVSSEGVAYGLAIIAFTIIIRILLLPLNIKQTRSQVKMQEVQPEVQKVQNKYKNDPAKAQQEVMKLYKEYGVSPFSGCLPLIVQMPILFALYYVFYNLQGIEGASFLWLPDLSSPDPYYILPVLTFVTTYLSSALISSKNKDNPQAKSMSTMNLFMAGFIAFMSLSIKSALVIYWVTNSLIQIIQTLIMKALDDKKKKATT